MGKENIVSSVARRLVITKVVATRSFQTPGGNFFVAKSAGFQGDWGVMGTDAVPTHSEDEEVVRQGMTLAESKIAQAILARSVELEVLDAAYSAGALNEGFYREAVVRVKRAFDLSLARMAAPKTDPKTAEPNLVASLVSPSDVPSVDGGEK